MSNIRNVARFALFAAGLAVLTQAASAASCGQLWFERNSIYAEAGHCFQTPQAVAAFGRGCFPPYGKLTPSQQARVNAILAQEARQGCS